MESGNLIERFDKKDLIGSGAYSDVYEAFDLVTNKRCALKEYSKFRLKKLYIYGNVGRINGIEAVQTEIEIMMDIQHQILAHGTSFPSSSQNSILQFIDTFEDPEEQALVLVTEFAAFGTAMSLHKEIMIATEGAWDEIGEEDNFAITYWSYKYTLLGSNKEPMGDENFAIYFKENEALRLFQQLIDGVQFLHSIGISHLDLKPDNLLIDNNHRLKISDFGSAVKFDMENNPKGLISHTPGTPAFWPPEFVHSFERDSQQDGENENMQTTRDIQDVFDGDADDSINVQEFNASEDFKEFERKAERCRFSSYDADIHACGVILYCFLHGCLPYCSSMAETFPERLYRRIYESEIELKEDLTLRAVNLLKILFDNVSRSDIGKEKRLRSWTSVKDAMGADYSFCVCQLTDIHLRKEEHAVIRGCDTTKTFEAVLNQVKKLDGNDTPELLLMTGDISDQPSIEAYRNVLSRLSSIHIPKYFLPGNHDDPKLMDTMEGMDTTKMIITRGRWNLILLSTHMPGADGGILSQEELAFLRRSLNETKANDRYALISLHHPPVPIGSQWMDCIGLENPQDLFRVTDEFRSQAKCILWGHIHQKFESKHGEIKLLGSPSTCFQFKPKQEKFVLDDENYLPGFRLLHLYDNGEISTEVRRTHVDST